VLLCALFGGALLAAAPASAATATHLVLALPGQVTPGQPTAVTVYAEDSSNGIDPTYRGTIHFSSSDPRATLPADYTFTGGDAGAHTFSVTFQSTQAQALRATDTRNASIFGETDVQSGAIATRSFTVGMPRAVTPDTPVTIEVIAYNGGPNQVDTAYRGTVHFTSTDTAATLPFDYTFTAADAGRHVFNGAATFRTVGNQRVHVADSNNTNLFGDAIVFVGYAPPPPAFVPAPQYPFPIPVVAVPTRVIPFTGAPATQLLAAGLAALMAGMVFVVASRRRTAAVPGARR
jgi:hypothetical protein